MFQQQASPHSTDPKKKPHSTIRSK